MAERVEMIEDVREIQTKSMPEIKVNRRKVKAQHKSFLRSETCKEIINDFGGMPKAGESLEIICNGDFDTSNFLDEIIDSNGYVDQLYIATWIINRDCSAKVFDYFDKGKIKEAGAIISNRTKQLRRQDWGFIIEGMIDRGIKVKIPHTHAKLFIAKNEAKNTYLTISGSGNWNLNKRIENYTITNSKNTFDFHLSWMLEMLSE